MEDIEKQLLPSSLDEVDCSITTVLVSNDRFTTVLYILLCFTLFVVSGLFYIASLLTDTRNTAIERIGLYFFIVFICIFSLSLFKKTIRVAYYGMIVDLYHTIRMIRWKRMSLDIVCVISSACILACILQFVDWLLQ